MEEYPVLRRPDDPAKLELLMGHRDYYSGIAEANGNAFDSGSLDNSDMEKILKPAYVLDLLDEVIEKGEVNTLEFMSALSKRKRGINKCIYDSAVGVARKIID